MISTEHYSKIRRVVILLLCVIFSPLLKQPLTLRRGGELWFSCNDVNDCTLTEFHTGEASVGGTVNSASPLSPETIFIELPMTPQQSEIALI